MTNLRTTLLTVLFAAGLARPALAANDLIGYVNLQRAIIEVEDGKRAKAKLEATAKKKQAELRAKEDELEAMKKRLEAASAGKKDDPKLRADALEFQQKFMALRETLLKEQEALKKQETQALSKITTKLRTIIENMGKREGYTLIMEVQGSSLLFAKPHLDLTNAVIRRYNQQSDRKGKKSARKKSK